MDLEAFTEKSRTVLQAAQKLALLSSHQRFTPEHILAALLEEPSMPKLLEAAGADVAVIVQRNKEALAKMPKVEGSGAGQMYLAGDTARVLENAKDIAKKAGDSFVTLERLLQALVLEKDAPAAKIVAEAGASPIKINKAVNEMRKGRTADSAQSEEQFEALK